MIQAFAGLPPATRGVLWMSVSTALYALTFITVRELSLSFPIFEIVFFRATVAMLAMLPWLARAGAGALRTPRWRLYGVRTVFTYSGMLCWFYGLANLPLADATALLFTSPFFTLIILSATLGERVGPRRWLAIAAGFAGALVIIRPGFATVGLATLGLMFTSVAYGGTNAATRALAITENPNAVVFYNFTLVVPLALVPAALTWVTPGWLDVPLILTFGLLSLLSMQCMTRALAAAPAGVVLPVFYLQLPLVAILAFLWYAEVPTGWVWFGGAIICASSYYIAHVETRRSRRSAENGETGA